MKSHTLAMFMRKSLLLGAVLAIGIITFDVRLASLSPIRVDINAAAAQELPAFIATSSLAAAAPAAWDAPQPVASSEEEARLASVPAPTAAAKATRTIQPKMARAPAAETPARLIIPSIGLDTGIDPVGINKKGEMEVPPGSSPNVGWYKGGPKPGQVGSAVLDAHVFAAFRDLRNVRVGDDVIIVTASGQRLRFVAAESTVFRLSELTSAMLFGRGGDRWLNLITCAGQPVGDTYSHRLVVYARFAEAL